jgi:hypothetical protein
MAILLWSPFPILIAGFALAVLWYTKKRNSNWAKIGRIICIGFIGFNVGFFVNGFDAKVAHGRQAASAYLIEKFTRQTENLINENMTEKARELLAQFNDQYPETGGDLFKTEELIKKIMKEYK